MTPGGERSGAGGRTCRSRPGGKGLGENGSGGLVWVWVGLAWARYFALSLPTAAAVAAAGEASLACAGFFPRLRGVLGVAAWPAEAVARPAGAAVATPRAPPSFSSAAVAAAGGAPVACAGSVPRVRGVLGVAAWPAEAVSRRAGVAAAAPRAPSSLSFAAAAAADEAPVARAGSAPRFRGGLGVAAWSAEAVMRPPGAAVAIPRAPFLLSSAAAAALGDAPGSCAGATPRVGGVPGAAVGAAAWLAGAAVSASCASGAPSRGGAAGLAVASAPHGQGPAAIHRHWEGRRGSHAAHASRHSSQSGAGPRALGLRGSSSGVGGSRTRWTPVTVVTSCARRKVCTPSRDAGAGRGGRGTGVAP